MATPHPTNTLQIAAPRRIATRSRKQVNMSKSESARESPVQERQSHSQSASQLFQVANAQVYDETPVADATRLDADVLSLKPRVDVAALRASPRRACCR